MIPGVGLGTGLECHTTFAHSKPGLIRPFSWRMEAEPLVTLVLHMGGSLEFGSLFGVLFIRVPYYVEFGDLKRDASL